MSIDIFQLVKERCRLAHINIRAERHGEEEVPAIDLKFEFSTANNLLSKLHADLREAFYKADESGDLAGGDNIRTLRFPLMKNTISWDLEIPRTLLRLHGDTPESDIVLGGGKTNNFKLEMLEGGTVNWSYRVQVSQPDEEAIAALSQVLHQVVPVSLECAEEDQKDLFKEAEQQTQQPMSAARQAAEQAFGKPGAQVDALPATGPGEVVFTNDGVQPGDAGHSYAAQDGDVVDATFNPGEMPAPATNVEPISRGKRGGGKKVAAGGLE